MLKINKMAVRFVTCAVIVVAFGPFGHAALAQISPGVTQSAAHTANITGTVTRSDGTPVAGADVKLNGPALLSTRSDDRGIFAFKSVPWGTYQIIVTSPVGTASRNNISLNGDITIAVQYQPQNGLRTIAHVSTTGTGVSINVTPASIASVNPSAAAFNGVTSWQQILNNIPGVNTGGLNGGGTTATTAIVGSPLSPVVLSINGALPYETSVMLDGMPFNNVSATACAGQGTDLSNVPMTAFDTADVVRGPGADAPSIVDSIGGTFVLHGPGPVEKNQFELSASNDAYGGVTSNMKAALRLGRLSMTFLYGVYDSPGPFGPNATGTLADTPTILAIDGQPFLGCTSSGGGCMSGPTFETSKYQNCYGCGISDSLLVNGVSENTAWTQHSYGAALSYDLTPSVTVQLFYAGSAVREPFPSFMIPIAFSPGSGYSGSIAPGTYDYFEPNVFNSLITTASHFLEEKATAYVGTGVLRLAALQDSFYDIYSTDGSICAPPNGKYRLWGEGYLGTSSPGTPVVFNGDLENVTFSTIPFIYNGSADSRDLLFSYAVQVGSGSNVGVSYVTSYYNNPYSYYEGIYGSGSQPPSVAETTNEVRIHGGAQVSDRLAVDASWYFANGTYHVKNPANPNVYTNSIFPYNAPRLGATWRANQDIVIRAAAGGGYALPPLFYLVGTNEIFPAGPYYYQYKTNVNLTPEQSFGFDVGTDVRFGRDTALSLDLYQTNLFGQFYESTTLTGTFAGLPLYTDEYGNLAETRYEGINLSFRHDPARGIYWHGSLGLTRAYLIRVPPGFYNSPLSGPNSVNTQIVPGINFNGAVGGDAAVPYATATAQLGYRWGPGKYFDLSPTYFGNSNAYYEPAFIELDAHAGYAITRNFSLSATFSNITGVYDRDYQLYTPTLGAPAIGGLPYALLGLPYGMRSVIVTANVTL